MIPRALIAPQRLAAVRQQEATTMVMSPVGTEEEEETWAVGLRVGVSVATGGGSGEDVQARLPLPCRPRRRGFWVERGVCARYAGGVGRVRLTCVRALPRSPRICRGYGDGLYACGVWM